MGRASILKDSTFAILSVCAVTLLSPSVSADQGVLGKFIGEWDIHARTLRPTPGTTRYGERYEWVLDGQFIRGETDRRADGSHDIVFGTYDKKADGYPFWIFSSSGTYIYLPPAKWNARTRTMEWQNPEGFDISYRSRCHFPDADHRHCNLVMKDWKGKVLLELQWDAKRRRN